MWYPSYSSQGVVWPTGRPSDRHIHAALPHTILYVCTYFVIWTSDKSLLLNAALCWHNRPLSNDLFYCQRAEDGLSGLQTPESPWWCKGRFFVILILRQMFNWISEVKNLICSEQETMSSQIYIKQNVSNMIDINEFSVFQHLLWSPKICENASGI